MSTDDRDILDTLRAELSYIEAGGYGRRVRTPHLPTSVFQDSLTCINFGYPYRAHPCSECFLSDFVPAEAQTAPVPCHHIPLDADGTTVEELDARDNESRKEEAVKRWLRERISEIEEQRRAGAARVA